MLSKRRGRGLALLGQEKGVGNRDVGMLCNYREPPRKKGSGRDEPACALALVLSVSDQRGEPGSVGKGPQLQPCELPQRKAAVRCPPDAWFFLLRDKD